MAEVGKRTGKRTHKNKKDAIKAAVERSESLKFNEGGLATQTKEAFTNPSDRLEAQRDERKLGVGLTSLEFEADMMPLLKKDPIAMLGYKASMPNRRFPSIQKLPENKTPLYYDVSEDPIGPNYNSSSDKIGYGRDHGSSKDIILHELRHRGLKILEERYKETDSFIADYGDMAHRLLDKADISGTKSNEFVVELYDNPDATYIKPGGSGSKNTTGYVADTLQFVDPNSDTQVMPDVADELLGITLTSEDHDEYRSLVDGDSLSKEEIEVGKSGLDKAAIDLLNEINVLGFDEGGLADLDGKLKLFNEGGAVMDEQMEMAFAEGERVDPVSGNEVPTGSMPEEVRDDIPAQLSEGEYVVPADVVRFFGVKFFEDIRNEAKRGFADMEANGRIGGEPIGMEMAEDELPFDISELQIVDDETEEQPMMNMGGYMRGYADGGLTLPSAVTDMTESTGIPTPVANLSGIEMKEYVGPNGEITYIQFINGVAQSVIPEGYTAKAAAPTTPAAPAVPEGLGVVTAPDDNNNTAHEDMMREARESIDWTSPDVGIEQYEKTMEQSNSMLAKGFSGLATVLGGPIVYGFMEVAKRHQNKRMIEGATARLEDPNIKGAEREKWVSIYNRLSGLDEDGKASNSFTEGLANLLTPDDGKEYRNGVLYDTKTGKVLKPGIANSKGNDVVAPAPTAKPQSGGGDNSAHNDMIKATQAAAKASKTTANLAKVKEKSKAAYKAATSTKKELDSQYGSGLNKGGLMKKK